MKLELFRILLIVSLFSWMNACSEEDDEDESSTSTTGYDENGFSTTAAGQLQISMVATGTSSSSSLKLATEPTDPNEKYYSNSYSLAGQPTSLTLYVTRMSLVRSNPAEGEESEVPIFINDDGRALRVTGQLVDMSSFFTEIKCYGADGTILSEDCPCGVDSSGSVIQKVDSTDENGNAIQSCPGEEDNVARSPISFINVSQAGTFESIKVTFKQEAAVQGCVEGYVRQTGYSASSPTDNLAWERYCTKSGSGTDTSASGSSHASSVFADSSFTAAGELSKFYITSQTSENGTYTINGGVTITEGSSDNPQITLAIDTSSMLRFFKADNYENKTDPDWSALSGSFFHARQFSAQNFVFVGQPGSVRGYEVTMSLSEDESGSSSPSGSSSNPSAYDECSSSLSSCARHAKGRLSVIYDSNGSPMLFNLTPTDGSGIEVSNQSSSGIDQSVLTSDSTLSGTYKFNLEATDGTNTTTTTAIYQMNFDVGVGSSFSAYSSHQYTGTNNGWLWGRLYMTREF